jgi:hypothetical protein
MIARPVASPTTNPPLGPRSYTVEFDNRVSTATRSNKGTATLRLMDTRKGFWQCGHFMSTPLGLRSSVWGASILSGPRLLTIRVKLSHFHPIDVFAVWFVYIVILLLIWNRIVFSVMKIRLTVALSNDGVQFFIHALDTGFRRHDDA